MYYAYGSGSCNNLQRYFARLGETIDKRKISKKSMKLWSAIKEEKHFFIFLYKRKHFAELWTAVSYFALEALVDWYSAKFGILLKTALKYKPLEPLTVNGVFFSVDFNANTVQICSLKEVDLRIFHNLSRKNTEE